MYETFYRFLRPPFRITPDPAFLYLSPSHKEALGSIIYGIDERKGFIVVLGDVGLGKTTIVRSYLDARDKTRVTPIYVFDPNVSFKTLLETIYRELGISNIPSDVPTLLNGLHQILIEEYRLGRNVVVIIDEVQNMPVATLEQLRMLSNLETPTEKLLQIVLAGQVEFAKTLDRGELRQLKQRVAVRSTLSPLTREETFAYIEFRLKKAGGSSAAVFTRAALHRIVRQARGIPRTVNILCDNALVTGLGYKSRRVTRAIVNEVTADLEGRVPVSSGRWVWGAFVVLVVIAASIALPPLLRKWVPFSFSEASAKSLPGASSTSPAPSHSDTSAGVNPPVNKPVSAPMQPPAAVVRPPAVERAPVEIRVVKRGEILLRMAREVYGFSGDEVVKRIIDANPDISDPDHIVVGSSIRFPEVSDLEPVTPSIDAGRRASAP